MSDYIENIPDNFWQIRWLDKYMEGHRGFIAGGCFKNILSGEKVKDIDIFFENADDFDEAVDLFRSDDYVAAGWSCRYENEKAIAFQKTGESVWVELIRSEFGTPEQILRSFDFTVTKMAYHKKLVISEDSAGKPEESLEYRLLYHADFFEHLFMKRLVLDENIPFPVGTWERTYRYKGYGFNMCRETKKKLLEALKETDLNKVDLSLYNNGGWD